jgi:hypothetical protein
MSGLSRRVVSGLVTATLAAATAFSDEIFLRSGGRVSGVIVERTRTAIVVETGPGRVTLPMALVAKVVEGRSPLEAYHERAAAIEPGDADGWAALARWAAERDMVTQSREAWQRVLSADPSNREANAALGRVEVDGTWMGQDEAYRARGYVSFEGRWVTPPEHEALVRERAAEEAWQLEAREAGLRVREAEARAREAEARAREAETPTYGGGNYGGWADWGGSYGWAGGGYGYGQGFVGRGANPYPDPPTANPYPPMRQSAVHPTRPQTRPPHRSSAPRPAAQPQPAKGGTAGVNGPPSAKARQD